jgi:hypothetical protein
MMMSEENNLEKPAAFDTYAPPSVAIPGVEKNSAQNRMPLQITGK